MPADSHYVSPEDVSPLLALVGGDPDARVRDEALGAAAALPLDGAARQHVGELVIERLETNDPLPRPVLAALGRLEVPAVQAHVSRLIGDTLPSSGLIRAKPRSPTLVAIAPGLVDPELVAAVGTGLLTGKEFPDDLTGLGLLPQDDARRLLSELIAELVAAQDADDQVLAAATNRLGRVVKALPVDVAAELPSLAVPVSEERANWLGGLVTLAPPADVLASVYERLDQSSGSARLSTVRAVRRVASKLGRPPTRWPQPTSRPGAFADLAGLVTSVQPAVDPPPSLQPYHWRGRFPVERMMSVGGDAGVGTTRYAVSDAMMGAIGDVLSTWAVGADDTRQAYARLDAPERVPPGRVFELRVGLAKTPSPGLMQLAPFPVPTRAFKLDVQLHAQGFDLLGGGALSLSMEATPDDPYPYQMLRLRAIDDDEKFTATRVVTAAYSIDERLIGIASRTVLVGDAVLATPARPPGNAWVLPDDPDTRPDLEIIIAPGNDQTGNVHTWSYRSPHLDVPTLAAPLRTEFEGQKDYAQHARQGIEDRETADILPEYLRGVSKIIGRAVPAEIWAALRAVTRAGVSPTVLLATYDPYVPWELAREPEVPQDAEHPAANQGTDPGPLGARAVIGRWIYNTQTRTAVPPAQLTARTMAVVSGEYKSNPLPEATDEATHLNRHYGAVQVSAKAREVLDFLARSDAPELLHLAVHGRFDMTGTADGILMDDGRTYLDPTSVLGVNTGPGGRIAVRFVFLNACQLGQEEKLLGQTAGMVPSFLSLGVGAAIAPLWKVNDTVARTIAESFYAEALSKSIPPAEYMRRQREAAVGRTGTELSTPLAYLFFGHPRLTIDWNHQGAS
ncbi:hypothetical protein DN069_32370 [Streptacidiphilus pinicola]|uniref:CHAT domain-containing protein n=1 Tax=Streptacidiphilus pinicola TaxID=2219663 RepID=A0A2X0IDQ3_9ACTN|nr:CHAT domain-containing protein [Streptacidiphilus pinicola]RAG81551.1 hypothetical protein DN069_32370 [Streptacidiphilus pinicola]